MEAGDSEFVQVLPDLAGAVLATHIASEMLMSAKEKYEKRVYDDSVSDSRDAIRVAASAVLLRDGYVASTFEATYSYLSHHYQDRLSLEPWHSMEKSTWGDGQGIIYRILKAIGIIKQVDKKQAKEAIATAEKFLHSASEMVGGL